MFENLFFARGVVKLYNPRRYSRGHRLPSLARAPWSPFYYYKKVKCMRRMCGRTGLPLLEDLCFHTLSKSGCRAFNSNVLRMCPNVPECATNVRPNVQTQARSFQNFIFSQRPQRQPPVNTVSKSGRRAFNSNVSRVCPHVPECSTSGCPNWG